MTIRVLIADDQALVRAGFRVILEAQPDIEVVGEASRRRRGGRRSSRELGPDVVLMDIRMPVSTGSRPRAGSPPAGRSAARPVLTTFDLDDYVYAALAQARAASCSRTPAPTSCSPRSAWSRPGDALLAPTITRRLIERFTAARRAGRRVRRGLTS